MSRYEPSTACTASACAQIVAILASNRVRQFLVRCVLNSRLPSLMTAWITCACQESSVLLGDTRLLQQMEMHSC